MSKVITLCRGKGCCPTIEKKDETQYLLKDDYGNEMLLTKENIEILYAAMLEL